LAGAAGEDNLEGDSVGSEVVKAAVVVAAADL